MPALLLPRQARDGARGTLLPLFRLERVSPFLSHPQVEYLDDAHARLLAPLTYVSRTAGRITVPAGFVTDFASVPRLPFAYWLMGGTARGPAIIHDFCYATHVLSRRQADAVFFEAMVDAGLWAWRRWPMWAAVRLFGWLAWKKDRG